MEAHIIFKVSILCENFCKKKHEHAIDTILRSKTSFRCICTNWVSLKLLILSLYRFYSHCYLENPQQFKCYRMLVLQQAASKKKYCAVHTRVERSVLVIVSRAVYCYLYQHELLFDQYADLTSIDKKNIIRKTKNHYHQIIHQMKAEGLFFRVVVSSKFSIGGYFSR